MSVTRRWHPSLPAILLVMWGLLIPLFEGGILVNGDGDPARHIRHGETILTQGDVIRTDPFSFTRPGAPFVGFEYGSQVLLALSHRVGGLPGMVVLTTLLIAGTLAGLAAWLLRRRMDPLLVVLATLAVAVLSNIHWLARPHVFSWPLTVALLTMLEARKRPPLWAFAILFGMWANLHGGWLYGLIVIGMYLTGHVLEVLVNTDPARRVEETSQARGLAAALLMATGATLVTPYGWRLPWHVVEYFRDPVIRNITQEFLSPDFHSVDLYPFLATLLAVMVMLALRPRPHWTHLVVLLGNTAMALISQRNIVLFALLSIPLLALDLAPWWDDTVAGSAFVRRFASNARTGATVPYVGLTLAVLALLAINHGRLAGHQVLADQFSAKRFPVQAVHRARSAGLQGRLFHEFIWGGYLLYSWPEQKVFIDGGTDFYGGALMRAQRSIINVQPGWRDSLDTWHIDMALLRSDGAMAAELGREPAWALWYRDSTAVLLRRH